MTGRRPAERRPSTARREAAATHEALLGTARRAVRAATAYLLPVFRSDMRVRHKGDAHDLVTEHDLASESLIRDLILAEVPDSTVLGEEGGAIGTGRIRWHVDPIDGTINFARGLPFWCVSVAAEVNGTIAAGAIAEPVTGHEFTALAGGPVRLDGRVVHRDPAAPESEAGLVSTFPRPLDLQANGDEALVATGRLTTAYGSHRCLGSGALGLAYVAVGWADATFDLHTNPWDVAAGSLMVRGTGGRFAGVLDGRIDEDPATAYRRPGYLAVGPGAQHPTLEDTVTRLSRRSILVR